MSASSSLSGNAAEPIVTEPGVVGSAVDDGLEAALVPPAGGEGAALVSFDELPLLPHAASSATPSSAAAAEWMRFMVLLNEVVHDFRLVIHFAAAPPPRSRWSRPGGPHGRRTAPTRRVRPRGAARGR